MKRHTWVGGVVVLLLVAGVWGGFNALGRLHKTQPAAEATGTPADVISTFTLEGHSNDGRRKWQVQGQTANLLTETVELSPVSATSFGETDLHLTSKQGSFNKMSRNVHLEKDVVVTTSDGARLTTNSFDWMAQRETGTTSDWVTVTRPGMEVVGKGAIGYPKLKRVRLQREITVTLLAQDGAQTVVTCEGPMEVDYKHLKARFWRNVQVRDPKGFIQCDRMDVALESQNKQIRQATCWGHVKLHHGPQVATADRAIYWKSPAHTQLLGHPRLVMLPEEERLGE